MFWAHALLRGLGWAGRARAFSMSKHSESLWWLLASQKMQVSFTDGSRSPFSNCEARQCGS